MHSSEGVEQGLVLSGGGAYGAFEVGVLKALTNGSAPHLDGRPLSPEIVTGTSVGAINAAMLVSSAAAGFPAAVAGLEEIWLTRIAPRPGSCGNGVYRVRGDAMPYFDPRCFLRHPLEPFVELTSDGAFFARDLLRRLAFVVGSNAGSVAERALEVPNLADLFDTRPLHDLLKSTVSLKQLHESPIKLRIATTNWRRALTRLFTNSQLTDALGVTPIVASASIPGVFPPINIEGDLFVDGGVMLNTPLEPAITARDPDTRHLVLHVIHLEPEIQDIPLPPIPNSLSTSGRLAAIFLGNSLARDVENVRQINRQVSLGKLYDDLAQRAPGGVDATGFALSDEGHPLRQARRVAASKVPVTVHRYRPPPSLLGSVLDMLDFRRQRTEPLIHAGEEEVRQHDCAAAGCVLANP